MEFCTKRDKRNRWRLEGEEVRDGAVTALQDYGCPLENVTVFKYLLRILTATDNDWPAAVDNLREFRKN